MYIRPYHVQADTVNIAVTASSQVLAINSTPIGVRSVRVVNTGTQTIFLKFGISTTTATLADGFPVLSNTVETFLLQNEVTHVACIASATGSTLYVTVGEGA